MAEPAVIPVPRAIFAAACKMRKGSRHRRQSRFPAFGWALLPGLGQVLESCDGFGADAVNAKDICPARESVIAAACTGDPISKDRTNAG